MLISGVTPLMECLDVILESVRHELRLLRFHGMKQAKAIHLSGGVADLFLQKLTEFENKVGQPCPAVRDGCKYSGVPIIWHDDWTYRSFAVEAEP